MTGASSASGRTADATRPTSPAPVGPVTVTVATTRAAVEALRPLWSSLGVPRLDADLDHFLAVVECSPGVRAPHVLHLRHADRDLLVVARLEERRFPLRFGYRTAPGPKARALVVSFDGILGARGEQDRRLAVDALHRQLDAAAADIVVWQKLDEAAPLRAELVDRTPATRVWSGPLVAHHRLETPDSLDALLAQRPSKSRQRLRRELSLFRRDHEGRWQIRRLDQPEERHRLGDVDRVAALSYQRGLDIGTVDDRLQRRLLALADERGWLRCWMLYLDDRPTAFWWGMRYGRIFEPGATGFDPDRHRDGVGTFTLMRMFEDLCADPEVGTVDFGYGDADYKQRFANVSGLAGDVIVFSRRPRAYLARATVTLNAAVAQTAERALERSEAVRRLRRRWRRRGGRRGGDA